MKILIVGSGGREHALAWRLKQSPRVTQIIAAPGNPGIAEIAECVPVAADNIEGLVDLARIERPNLVIVGPEVPLVLGLADKLRAIDIPVFGPSARAAMLEGSKGFSKDFMAKYNIPTARYRRFTAEQAAEAKAYLETFDGPPYVLKADGLAAGKGVVIPETKAEAEAEIDAMLGGKFGAASASLVIEEFMHGEEASFFALCDGETAVALAGAQDHKRVGDGDTGPNTGGMGAYSPAPILDAAMQQRVMDEIVTPTVAGMKKDGRPYRGVLFVGLMIDAKHGPRVVEYNVRFGDPECQVIMARLKDDPLPQFLACATGGLAGCARLERFSDHAVTVVMAGAGYPGEPKKGGVIGNLDEANKLPGVTVFHSGTAQKGDDIIANGGRVLTVTATAPTLKEAATRAYEAVDKIDWPDGFCRRDIAWRALKRARFRKGKKTSRPPPRKGLKQVLNTRYAQLQTGRRRQGQDMTEANPTDLFSGTKDVAESHKFDESKLAAWMEANVEGYKGPLTVRQFKGGQSNPTYQLITPTKKYVMRRKPPGKLLPSAHAVDREFRVIAALYPLGFPVAKPYGLCEDESVTGTMFYIMDMVEGRIIWDATLPDYTPAQRAAIYEAKVSTFAALHNVDWKKAGLEGFGKEGDYVARQVHRWTKQYQLAEASKIPEMDKLIDWLPKNIPPGETTTIVHGDYRIDNMVLHPTEPKVIAVLDWELSTLGDPLADFTYHLMSWVMPSSDPQRPSIAGVVDKPGYGIPTKEQYVARYCELTGRKGLPDLDFYFAYNAFRLAGILQGIVGRVRDGTASNAAAAQNEGRVAPLAHFAYECALRAGMPA